MLSIAKPRHAYRVLMVAQNARIHPNHTFNGVNMPKRSFFWGGKSEEPAKEEIAKEVIEAQKAEVPAGA